MPCRSRFSIFERTDCREPIHGRTSIQTIKSVETPKHSDDHPFALWLLMSSDSYFFNTSSADGNTFSNISHTINSVKHKLND